MKKLALFFLGLSFSGYSFAQIPFFRITPDSSLSTSTSAIITNNIVVLQSENKVYAVDCIKGTVLWNKKLPYWAYAGSLSNTNTRGKVFLHALKDGPSQTEIIYSIDANSGVTEDSLETKGIAMVNIYPVPGNDNEFAFIGQEKGKFIASVINKKTGKILRTFFTEGNVGNTIPNAMAFSPDGKKVAVALINEKYEIRVYSVADGKLLYTVQNTKAEIHDLEFSNDEKYLYYADSRSSFYIVNTQTQQVEKKVVTGGIHSHIAVSADDKYAILSGSEGAPVIRVNLSTGEFEKSNYRATTLSCNADEDGKYAVVTGRGMGPYFVTKYPYCIVYSIAPGNSETFGSNSTSVQFKKCDQVLVEWNGQWYNAEVLEVNNDRYKIHYSGYGNEWDEWVTSGRMTNK